MQEYYDLLVEQVKEMDLSSMRPDPINGGDLVMSNEEKRRIETKIIEDQKIYFWIRLYVNNENLDIKANDDLTIKYIPLNEELVTKFICYGKKGTERDHNGEITSYNSEDDKKILCLLIDSKDVNYSEKIPFIRTLFKAGFHYDYQLLKRDELTFTNGRTEEVIEYYDVDF